jgi:hypothetical protein
MLSCDVSLDSNTSSAESPISPTDDTCSSLESLLVVKREVWIHSLLKLRSLDVKVSPCPYPD